MIYWPIDPVYEQLNKLDAVDRFTCGCDLGLR